MIDQTSQFFALLTAVGEAKHAGAIASGQPWMFEAMGVGDANGTQPIPDRLQTQLINEWRRAPLNQVRIAADNPNVVITEQIIPADVGGQWIREIGLYDREGDLVAVANCAPSYKPLLSQGSGKTQVVRMNFIVSSAANIELKVDPSVVVATRDYVDWKIQTELAKLDYKQSVRVVSTLPVPLDALPTIDGIDLLAGDRVLLTAQPSGEDNGVYEVAAGTWARARDADSSLAVTPGMCVQVEQGLVNGDSFWQLVTDGPITLNQTALHFEMIAGPNGVIAGTYRSVTVDQRGRVIGGSNPTTLDGYGITDALAMDENLADVENVTQARANLGLGSAAVHDVGAADQQIPLMQQGAGLGGWGYGEPTLPAQTLDLDSYPACNGEVRCVTGASSGLPVPGVGGIVQFFCGESGPLAQQMTLTEGGSVRTWQRTRSHVTVAWRPWVTLWHSGNLDLTRYQTTLGFTPVQQGGGYNQYASKVYLGYATSGAVSVQVDATSFGDVWSDHVGVAKVRAAVVSFTAGTVGSYGLFRVGGNGGTWPGTLVAGGNLIFSDCQGKSNHGSPAGTWMLMGGVFNADYETYDSVTVCLRVA